MFALISRLLEILPAPLHRVALTLAQKILLWRHELIRRPTVICSVIVQNELGQIMLVRHSYRAPDVWMLPSGRMGSGEAPIAAATRELKEEVGCNLDDAQLIEFEDEEFWDPRFHTFVVGGLTSVTPNADLREIDQAAFFNLSELPEPLDEFTAMQLARWQLRNSFPIPVPAFVRPEHLSGPQSDKNTNTR
jgi:ADP-ribose pyrophosphatase YjhB (NUDIX family)